MQQREERVGSGELSQNARPRISSLTVPDRRVRVSRVGSIGQLEGSAYLRDILDAPEVVRLELSGAGWADVGELYNEVLVYGARHFCDHEREYGLPFRPRYCGWVAEAPACDSRERDLLAVTAGGGGDALFGLAVGVLEAASILAGLAERVTF